MTTTEGAPAILFEDESLLVLHKPVGLPSAALNSGSGSRSDSTRQDNVSATSFAESHFRGAILLHRLDNGTSGALAFAKNETESERLRSLWKGPQVKKVYRAIVSPSQDVTHPSPFTIADPIAHSAKSAKKMIVFKSGRRTPKSATRGQPQPAVTHLTEVLGLADSRFDLTLRIETGVRHQIRAHLSAYDLPILGDTVYQGAASPRLWLHAWKLTLPLSNGTELTLVARLPGNWPAALT